MRFSIVLIIILSFDLTANTKVSGQVNSGPVFYLSKVFSGAVKNIPRLYSMGTENIPSASKAKNNLFLSVSSMVAVGKHVAGLLWKLADAKAEGLSGAAKADEIEDEIDELAILTDGTFLGSIETAPKTTSLKNGISTGNELQDMGGTPQKGPKPSNSGSTPNPQDAQKSLSFLDSDDDDFQISRSLFSNLASSATAAASGSSHNSGGSKTPSNEPSTPRSSSTASEGTSMGPIKTLADLIQRADPILKGVSQIEKMGLKPLILHKKHWIEASNTQHPFVGSNEAANNFALWQKNPEGSPNFLASPAGLSVKKIEYLDSTKLAQKLISPSENGNALNSQGEVMTNFSGMIVIGPDGQAYAMPGAEGLHHHSSFFSGGALIWSGLIIVDKTGKITELSDESGHYHPADLHTLQGLKLLQELGFNLEHTRFEAVFKPGLRRQPMNMPIQEYIKFITQEISNTHVSKAQTAPSTAAAASQQTQDEIAK